MVTNYMTKYLQLSNEQKVVEVKMLLLGYECFDCIYFWEQMCVEHRKEVREFFNCKGEIDK